MWRENVTGMCSWRSFRCGELRRAGPWLGELTALFRPARIGVCHGAHRCMPHPPACACRRVQSEESLARLDKLVAHLNETQTAIKHDRRGLAALFAGLQQFMEDALGINVRPRPACRAPDLVLGRPCIALEPRRRVCRSIPPAPLPPPRRRPCTSPNQSCRRACS